MAAHYLPLDAIALLTRLAHKKPGSTAAVTAVLFLAQAGSLRKRFHCGWGEAVIFSLLVTGALLFIAACLYLLATHHGYRLAI